MGLWSTVVLFFIILPACIYGNGFVEEVACTGSTMTIVVNKSDADVVKWIKDPQARPIVYVYGHKERTPCGMALKPIVDNASATITYNFTIPYGPTCSVYLADLGPNFQTAETTVAIENNAQVDSPKGIRINHVFCLYTKQVETLRINDVSNNNEVVASVGGKPKPKVQMLFRDPEGRPLKAAKFGDPVQLYLMLSPDNAYKAINPKHCLFSDREEMEEPDAKTLTFVQSNGRPLFSCPVSELSEVIRPVSELSDEIFYTRFQAFRFGERPTVYAHCKVEVCLDQNDCAKKNCYPKIINSTLASEALRLRRLRRGASSGAAVPANEDDKKSGEEISLSNALTVLDHRPQLEVIGQSNEMCLDQRVYQSLFLVIGLLLAMLLLSLFLIVNFIRKLRRYKKTTRAAMNLPSIYYAHPPVASGRVVPNSAFNQVSHTQSCSYSPSISASGFRGSAPSGLDYNDHGHGDQESMGTGRLSRIGNYFASVSITDDHAIPRVRNVQ